MQIFQQTETELIAMEKLILMVYNKPWDMIEAVFGDRHQSYLEDQRYTMQNNLGKWWTNMDPNHRVKALEVAEAHYINEAKNRVQSW